MNYRKQKSVKTSIRRNTSMEGETIEMKVERIVNNKEPITDGAPIMYTERKDGVLPATDIRTDRWEVALDAMDLVSKDRVAKREARIIEMNEKKNGRAESTDDQANTQKGGQNTD